MTTTFARVKINHRRRKRSAAKARKLQRANVTTKTRKSLKNREKKQSSKSRWKATSMARRVSSLTQSASFVPTHTAAFRTKVDDRQTRHTKGVCWMRFESFVWASRSQFNTRQPCESSSVWNERQTRRKTT